MDASDKNGQRILGRTVNILVLGKAVAIVEVMWQILQLIRPVYETKANTNLVLYAFYALLLVSLLYGTVAGNADYLLPFVIWKSIQLTVLLTATIVGGVLLIAREGYLFLRDNTAADKDFLTFTNDFTILVQLKLLLALIYVMTQLYVICRCHWFLSDMERAARRQQQQKAAKKE